VYRIKKHPKADQYSHPKNIDKFFEMYINTIS